MFIARFLKKLKRNVYIIITIVEQLQILSKTINIAIRINNRMYQVKTNIKNSRYTMNITSRTYKENSINLNASESNRKKCFNYEKKNHIAKRCKENRKLQQHLDILENDSFVLLN